MKNLLTSFHVKGCLQCLTFLHFPSLRTHSLRTWWAFKHTVPTLTAESIPLFALRGLDLHYQTSMSKDCNCKMVHGAVISLQTRILERDAYRKSNRFSKLHSDFQNFIPMVWTTWRAGAVCKITITQPGISWSSYETTLMSHCDRGRARVWNSLSCQSTLNEVTHSSLTPDFENNESVMLPNNSLRIWRKYLRLFAEHGQYFFDCREWRQFCCASKEEFRPNSKLSVNRPDRRDKNDVTTKQFA